MHFTIHKFMSTFCTSFNNYVQSSDDFSHDSNKLTLPKWIEFSKPPEFIGRLTLTLCPLN